MRTSMLQLGLLVKPALHRSFTQTHAEQPYLLLSVGEGAKPMKRKRSEEATLDSLLSWFKMHGGKIHPKLAFVRSEIGWGGQATGVIYEDEELISIPFSAVLSHEVAKATPIGQIILKEVSPENISPKAILQAVMIAGRASVTEQLPVSKSVEKRSRSSDQANTKPTGWVEYLDSLPRSYVDPLWMRSEDIATLEGTELGLLASSRREAVEKSYNQVQPANVQAALHRTRVRHSVLYQSLSHSCKRIGNHRHRHHNHQQLSCRQLQMHTIYM